MNLEMSTQELRTQVLHGWLGSLALHGLLLFSLLPLLRLSLLTVPKEPFHWDVALVQSTPTVAVPIQNTNTTQPIISKPTERSPMPAHAVRTFRRVAAAADPIVPIEPQTTEPVAPISQPNIAPPAASPSEAATASIVETPAISTPEEPSAPQTAAAPSQPTESAQLLPPPAVVSHTEAPSTPHPDYRWLQQAIFQRLDELKRASRPSLDESRPFKVTVKAVVSKEGMLLDSSVVKSSGIDRIDQEAMALVQRAFPMPLDRPLDRQQIAMRIPITYSRE